MALASSTALAITDDPSDEDPDQPFIQGGIAWDDVDDDQQDDYSNDSDEGDEGDSDCDSDASEELIAYDLEDDDEDLQTIPPPRYVRDLLDYLRKADDRDKVEAGLAAAADVLAEAPLEELQENAARILSSLLHVGTAGWLEEGTAASQRVSALVKTVVACPVSSVDYLTDQLFNSNKTLQDRLDILDTMTKAAVALSHFSDPHTHEPRAPSLPSLPPITHGGFLRSNVTSRNAEDRAKAADNAEVVRRRVEAKTRRWGSTLRAHHEQQFSTNQFGPVAHLFFFPLINGAHSAPSTPRFDVNTTLPSVVQASQKEAERTAKQFHDPLLLSRLIYTLGILLQCSGTHPGTRILARALMEVVWVARLHPRAEVRRSTLFALLRVLTVLPSYILADDFLSDLQELTHWLVELKDKEPDEQSRQSAVLCLISLKELFESRDFGPGAQLLGLKKTPGLKLPGNSFKLRI